MTDISSVNLLYLSTFRRRSVALLVHITVFPLIGKYHPPSYWYIKVSCTGIRLYSAPSANALVVNNRQALCILFTDCPNIFRILSSYPARSTHELNLYSIHRPTFASQLGISKPKTTASVIEDTEAPVPIFAVYPIFKLALVHRTILTRLLGVFFSSFSANCISPQ